MINYEWNIWDRRSFKISGLIRINVSKKKLWFTIIEPGHLKKYHPFCKEHDISKWDGVGCKDVSLSYEGKTINREIIEWDDGVGYHIKMNNDNKHDTKVKFEILEKDNQTYFKVVLESNAYRKTPRPLWYPIAFFLIVPSYKKYYKSLLRGLKFYVETGKKVRRNQFGNHKKYSS
jgi:hypothetical protein